MPITRDNDGKQQCQSPAHPLPWAIIPTTGDDSPPSQNISPRQDEGCRKASLTHWCLLEIKKKKEGFPAQMTPIGHNSRGYNPNSDYLPAQSSPRGTAGSLQTNTTVRSPAKLSIDP